MMPDYLFLVLSVVCFCSLEQIVTCQSEEQVVHVWPNCTAAAESGLLNNDTNCTEFDRACGQFTTDITLLLKPGRHVLHESCFVSDLKNLQLVGEPNEDGDVTITCDDGNGLVFTNISGLHMQGLKIQNCGLSGPNLEMMKLKLDDLVDNFIYIPTTINISVVLVQCEHVSLERITITDTVGLGLLGVNVLGNSSLQDVTFTNNTRSSKNCMTGSNTDLYPFLFQETVFNQVGGGAYFLYLDSLSSNGNMTDHHLAITDSLFQYNSDCSFAGLSHVNFQYFHEYLNQSDYIVGAGGGLSVFMAQQMYSVEVNVYRSTFADNDARYGGGVYLAFFLGVQQSGVRFNNCTIERNGLLSGLVSFASGGAGMAIFTDILRPNDLRTGNEMNIRTRRIFIEFTSTHFTNNSASARGGALMMYSQYHTQTVPASASVSNVYVNVTMTNCVFYGNMATYGSGAFLRQSVELGIDGGVGVWMRNVQFVENGKTSSVNLDEHHHEFEDRHIDTLSSNSESSALSVRSMQIFMSGSILFSDNAVTGCSFHSSTVDICSHTNVSFVRNQGHLGGAVRLQGSVPSIFVNRNTTIFFSENKATTYGGAIYYAPTATRGDLRFPQNFSDCFLFPSIELCPIVTSRCEYIITTANVSLEFHNNQAPLGSSLYGTTLESCPWTRRLIRLKMEAKSTLSLLEFIGKYFPHVVSLNDNQDSPFINSSVLSTPPVDIEVVNRNRSEPFKVYPGELINFDTTIRDSFGHSIPSVIRSHVSNQSTNARARLGDSGYWFADQELEWTPLTITGESDQAINVTFLTLEASASTQLSFEIQTCPLGFEFNSDNNSCVCDERLLNSTPVRCDMTNFKLIVPHDYWVGPISNENGTSNNSDLVVHECLRRYCRGGIKIQLPNFDSQCTNKLNRKGFLCGSCEANYSIAFGAKVECKKCSNYYIFTFLSFAAGGVLLFVAIALLGITIDKGWLNMVLFYSNGVYVYSYIRVSYPVLQILSVPLASLSLKTEIDTCLYDGMTALAAVAIELVFPIYLFVLMIIFALIARRSTWLSSRFSPVSTFVTLALLSYVSILETCIDILGVTVVTTLDGRRMYRWVSDPTQAYFSGWHILLGIIAFILLIGYIVPFPLVLLFPPIAYKCFGRLKPFIDALYAPFEPECRFWLGLRLLIRAVMFVLPIFATPETSFAATAVILVCLTHIQLCIKPFKKKWQNILDSTLIADLIVLTIGSLYFRGGDLQSNFDKIFGNLSYAILVGGAYMVFVYILIIHLRLKYSAFDKVFMLCKQKLKKRPASIVMSLVNSINVSAHDSETAEAESQHESPTDSAVRTSGSIGSEQRRENTTSFIENAENNGSSQNGTPSAVTHTELFLGKNRVDYSVYRESIVEEF